jgi:hypothetical protein
MFALLDTDVHLEQDTPSSILVHLELTCLLQELKNVLNAHLVSIVINQE